MLRLTIQHKKAGRSAAFGLTSLSPGRERTQMFTLAELENVIPLVRASVPPTPQYAWPLLKAHTGVEVVVKHENHTPIGAFKVRGGIVYLDRLKRERPQVRGVVTATRGNHSQSLAFAGARAGVAVTVLVPLGNSTDKNAAIVRWAPR